MKCSSMTVFLIGGCCKLCGSVEHLKKDCPESKTSGEISEHPFRRGNISIVCFCLMLLLITQRSSVNFN